MTIYSLDLLLPQFGTSFCSCPVLTVASWPTYRFLRMQVRWSGIPISWWIFQFVVIHRVKWYGIVNKVEVDVFLELFCIFSDQTDVGNVTSGSSVFSKSSLNIWKFTVHGPQLCLTQWNYDPCHVLVESSNKTWSTGEGKANHFSILALRTPWTLSFTASYMWCASATVL